MGSSGTTPRSGRPRPIWWEGGDTCSRDPTASRLRSRRTGYSSSSSSSSSSSNSNSSRVFLLPPRLLAGTSTTLTRSRSTRPASSGASSHLVHSAIPSNTSKCRCCSSNSRRNSSNINLTHNNPRWATWHSNSSSSSQPACQRLCRCLTIGRCPSPSLSPSSRYNSPTLSIKAATWALQPDGQTSLLRRLPRRRGVPPGRTGTVFLRLLRRRRQCPRCRASPYPRRPTGRRRTRMQCNNRISSSSSSFRPTLRQCTSSS